MASLTIRDIPDALLARMREVAAHEQRSLNRQVLVLLESSLQADGRAERQRSRAEIEAQVQAWQHLAEQFGADVDIVADDIVNARTAGRPNPASDRIQPKAWRSLGNRAGAPCRK